MDTHKKEIYIFGHKNPDTDSICAAIAYAYLKNQIVSCIAAGDGQRFGDFVYTEETNPDVSYVARRAGQLNPETEFVLKRFNTPAPVYVNDVRAQVCDIDLRKVSGVPETISLKQAWRYSPSA